MPRANLPFEDRIAAAWPPADWSDVGVVVAVSSGADSVALARCLAHLQGRAGGSSQLILAHFNHALRAAADEDERFVGELARKLGLRFEVGRADVRRLAKDDGDGLEAAARSARYDFLRRVAEAAGARHVVTAHTADDQAETILFRALRGTSLDGLSGMRRARRLGEVVSLLRPMLDLRRREVTEYLAALGQSHRHDESNDDLRFARNRARRLLPLAADLLAADPVDSLTRLGKLAADTLTIVHASARPVAERAIRAQGADEVTLDCHALAAVGRALARQALVLVWADRDWPRQAMTFEHWDALAEMATTTDGAAARTLPGNISATRRGELLTLSHS